jgi:hypothetical protein
MTTTTRYAPRLIARLKAAVSEMNYSQRRLFELRTGIPGGSRSSDRRQIDELEALFRAKAI